MTRPTLVDVANAILKVKCDPAIDSFKPSKVRECLQETGRFTSHGSELSAQCQPHLQTLSHRGWIKRVQNVNQFRNLPYRIVDLAALQSVVNIGSNSDDYDQIVLPSKDAEPMPNPIENRLIQKLGRIQTAIERIETAISRIEKKIQQGRVEEFDSYSNKNEKNTASQMKCINNVLDVLQQKLEDNNFEWRNFNEPGDGKFHPGESNGYRAVIVTIGGIDFNVQFRKTLKFSIQCIYTEASRNNSQVLGKLQEKLGVQLGEKKADGKYSWLGPDNQYRNLQDIQALLVALKKLRWAMES